MKAIANREGLLTAFQTVASVVPARTPKPILRCARLEVGADGVTTLSATDLELGIRYQVSGLDPQTPGVVVLPAAETISILRELADETVMLEASEHGVRIAGASSRFDLPSEDPLGYPEIPTLSASGHKLKAAVLTVMIRRTVFAAAPENSRYALHSVLVEFENGNANFVATDGKRLARMPGKVTEGGGVAGRQWLLPPKALALAQKVLIDPEEEVELILGDNEALFRTAKVTIYTRLVEGRYPNYHDVFPPPATIHIPLAVSKFYGSIRQAKIVTSDESKGVEFRFRPGMLTLESRGQDSGSAVVQLPVGYDGDDLDVTFDPQLLIDALRILDGEEEIMLDMVDSRRAAVFRGRDQYEYVVMPLTKEH